MEHVADDIEILDELLDEAPSEPTPIHRYQGIFLFFSISLGALGLGASLAFFTREIRPARRAARRAAQVRRAPAPSTPGLRELVTLPLKPALDAGDEEVARSVSHRATPTRPVDRATPVPAHRGSRPSRPPGGATAAMVAAPVLPPSASEDTSSPATAPSTPGAAKASLVATAAAVVVPTGSPVDPVLPASRTPAEAPRRLAEAPDAIARAFLGKLAELLETRYAFESPELATLLDGEEPLAREQKLPLPSWMNIVYLERLTGRALERTEQDSEALRVTPGKFGSGTLSVTLGDEEAPGLSLEIEKPSAKTQVALVVDDVGYGGSSTRKLLDLRAPFSVAILPFYPGSTWSLKTSIEHDLEPMLHLPMLPKGAVGKYRNNVVIGPDLSSEEILSRARRAIESLPGIVGVNNHMGSRATESWFVMGEVLPVIREKGLFFVDSVTSNRSVAYRSARKLGLRTAKRTTAFLDNDPSYEGVKQAFQGLLRRCKPGQRHVAILHDKHDSVRAMREAIPLFRDRDIELAFAGDMVE